MKSDTNPRFCAVQSIMRCLKDKAFSNIEISNTLKNNNFSTPDASLYTFLVHGALERILTIDFFIDRLSDKSFNKIDESTKAILRIGFFQLLYADKIPPSAACNESVNIATQMKLKSGGFINAILRNASRNLEYIKEQINNLPQNIKYSISESIYNLIKEQYPDNYERIFETYNYKEKLPIRVNTLKITIDELMKKFDGLEISNISPFGLVSEQSNTSEIISKIGSEYYIQSIASQYSTVLLNPQPGETIIDVCACPGGKSISAAIEMKNKGRIISLDLHKNKLSLIEKSCETLSIDIIETGCNDARNPIEKYIGIADRVICDVPCSGLGEMSSKPEIRYKNTNDFEKLPDLQYNILKSSIKYLNDEGKIVYSTCTINKNENENVINKFIKENSEFLIDEMKTFMPDIDGEGFFVCKLIKKNRNNNV